VQINKQSSSLVNSRDRREVVEKSYGYSAPNTGEITRQRDELVPLLQ
jgi:hypothetical protein